MGEHQVTQDRDNQRLRAFMRALLDDVHALERMCAEGLIESGIRRIGAEQEMFLVDRAWRPAPLALPLLERLGDERFTIELAQFNLEANLSPQVLGGGCLRAIEDELRGLLQRAREEVRSLGGEVVLTGILPTLEKAHLGLDSMTPTPRFFQLNQVMSELRGQEFQTYIKGLDELHTLHDNVMLEACNTSFQVHFQVGAEEFPRFYNLAQVVTAPVLAAAVNSPLLLQHRLWHETRVALFQQSLDSRSRAQQARGKRQRVSFGDDWIRESVLEIFREDVARFRVLLTSDLGESSMDILDRGEIPPLKALCLHNGTVYRWNRPCYGVHDGVAHLRIENRALPAGPTVVDEIANAAFYFGVLAGLAEEHRDVTQVFAFDDAKGNFMAAARYGLEAQFRWFGGKTQTARELILKKLLPVAREGLQTAGVDAGDVGRYLDVIEERVRRRRTGAQWVLDSLEGLGELRSRDARYRTLVASMCAQEQRGEPVHTWELAQAEDAQDWRESYRTVGQFMTTDVFTVHPEDLVDLAASVMEWEHIRHVPVEDHDGKLVGLVSHRALIRLLGRGSRKGSEETPVAVRDIMRPETFTVSPDTSSLEAIETMRQHRVGCLPVVDEGKLVGIVTEHDFIEVARSLLEEQLRSPGGGRIPQQPEPPGQPERPPRAPRSKGKR